MRSDADRVIDLIVAEQAQRDASGDAARPHPGLVGLVARSGRRTSADVARQSRRMASSVSRLTAAQAFLDRAEYARGSAAEALAEMPESLERPRLGTVLTRSRSVWMLLVAVLIPMEAFLTYPQLLVLGMSNFATFVFAALIAISLVVVAEVVGLLAHHVFVASETIDDGRGRGSFYWMVAALAVVILAVGVVTLSGLARAREHNQNIVAQRAQRAEDEASALSGTGFLKPASPAAATPAGAGDQLAADRLQVDLSWTFGLQFLVFLAASGIALRSRMADEFNEVEADRRGRLRASRLAEVHVRRGEQRVARQTGSFEAAMRRTRLRVEAERDLLEELFQRVRSGVREHDRNIDVVLPTLPDLEEAVEAAIAPHFPDVAQPTVAGVPAGDPPPPPVYPPPPVQQAPTAEDWRSPGQAGPPEDPPRTEDWRSPEQAGPTEEWRPPAGPPPTEDWRPPAQTRLPEDWSPPGTPVDPPTQVDPPAVAPADRLPGSHTPAAENGRPPDEVPGPRPARPPGPADTGEPRDLAHRESEYDIQNGAAPREPQNAAAPQSEFDALRGPGQPRGPGYEPSELDPVTPAGRATAAHRPLLSLSGLPTPGSVDPAAPYRDALERVMQVRATVASAPGGRR